MPEAVGTPTSPDAAAGHTTSAPAQHFPVILSLQMLSAEKALCKHDIFQTVDKNGGTFHLLNTMHSSVKTKETSFICIDLYLDTNRTLGAVYKDFR